MKAKISTAPNGEETTIEVTLPRIDIRKIVDRWTWDEMTVTFQSGREKFSVTFPKLEEQK